MQTDRLPFGRNAAGKGGSRQSGSGFISPVGDTGTLVQNADGTFTYTEKDASKENYDLQGRLRSLVDAKGNSLAFTYASDVRDSLWGILPRKP